MGPHYFQVPRLRICLLIKFISNPGSVFEVLCGQPCVDLLWRSFSCVRGLSPLRSNGWPPPSCFSLDTRVLVTAYLVPCFPHFYAFCWWFCCLKWPHLWYWNTAQYCWLREGLCCFMEKTLASHLLPRLQRCPRGFDINESTTCVLNEGFVNRNPRKTRLHIDWPMKMWPEAHRNLTLYFSWEQAAQYLLIQNF